MIDETTTIEAPAPPSAVVLFGNTAPQMKVRIPLPDATPEELAEGRGMRMISVPAKHISQSETRIELQPDILDEEFVNHTLSTDNDRVLWMIAKSLPDQHMSTSAQPASFNYIALTASATTIVNSSTALAGEIATGGGGLVRKQVTYAHTAGTNTSTLTGTFTANGSDVLPVVVAQIGVFNASSSVTMGYNTSLSSTSTLTVSGDSTTVTWTDTAG